MPQPPTPQPLTEDGGKQPAATSFAELDTTTAPSTPKAAVCGDQLHWVAWKIARGYAVTVEEKENWDVVPSAAQDKAISDALTEEQNDKWTRKMMDEMAEALKTMSAALAAKDDALAAKDKALAKARADLEAERKRAGAAEALAAFLAVLSRLNPTSSMKSAVPLLAPARMPVDADALAAARSWVAADSDKVADDYRATLRSIQAVLQRKGFTWAHAKGLPERQQHAYVRCALEAIVSGRNRFRIDGRTAYVVVHEQAIVPRGRKPDHTVLLADCALMEALTVMAIGEMKKEQGEDEPMSIRMETSLGQAEAYCSAVCGAQLRVAYKTRSYEAQFIATGFGHTLTQIRFCVVRRRLATDPQPDSSLAASTGADSFQKMTIIERTDALSFLPEDIPADVGRAAPTAGFTLLWRLLHSPPSVLGGDFHTPHPTTFGDVRLGRRIGLGGSSTVYAVSNGPEAEMIVHGRPSEYGEDEGKVIKIPHFADGLALQAEKEALEAIAGHGCAHLPTLQGTMTAGGRLALIISPRAVPLRACPFSVANVTRAMQQCAQALQVLHAKRWVHADVRFTNMVVKSDGTAVLVDFGNAVPDNAAIDFFSLGDTSCVADALLRQLPAVDHESASHPVTLRVRPVHDLLSLAYTYVLLLSGRCMSCPWGECDQSERGRSTFITARADFIRDVCQDPGHDPNSRWSRTNRSPLLGSELGRYIDTLNAIAAGGRPAALTAKSYKVPRVPDLGISDEFYYNVDRPGTGEAPAAAASDDGGGGGAARGGGGAARGSGGAARGGGGAARGSGGAARGGGAASRSRGSGTAKWGGGGGASRPRK